MPFEYPAVPFPLPAPLLYTKNVYKSIPLPHPFSSNFAPQNHRSCQKLVVRARNVDFFPFGRKMRVQGRPVFLHDIGGYQT